MPEIRFEAEAEPVAVIDGYCSVTGKCRTEFKTLLLKQLAKQKLHEACVVMRVAAGNPTVPGGGRKP